MKETILFTITTFAAIALFVGGFFVPPMGIIDGSILKAGGILLGFGSVAQVPLLARRGIDVKLQHGQSSMTVINPDNNTEDDDGDTDD